MGLFVAGMAVIALFFWRFTTQPVTDTGPTPGGRLVATSRSEPSSFNRLARALSAEELVSRLTQASLVRVNRMTGLLEPWLAQAWTTSPDGLTWTLRLREGVAFSDGAPFTAADVLFTFDALYDPKVGSPMASSLRISDKPIAVRVLDDHTVLLVFPAAFGPGLSLLDSLPILPSHKLRASLQAGAFGTAWSVTTPPGEIVGLGPFVISEYRPGERLVFARNPHYWRRDAQGRALPYLDRLELQFVPEQNAELLRLESGEVDLTTSEVRAEDLAALQPLVAQRRLQLVTAGVGVSPDGLWFNLTPGAAAAKGRPWLQSSELRRAISLATDREAIVNTVYLGAAEPAWTPVTSSHGDWYLPDLPRPPRDAMQAMALLRSVGLVDRNGDGLLEDKSGTPARFSILTQKGHTTRERTVAILQDQLKQLGLTVDVVAVDPGTIFKNYSARTYDAIYFVAPSDSTDPARNLDFWMSSGSYHYWNADQKTPATPWEATIDDLMRKQSTSIDPAERRRLFAEVQRTMAAEAPFICFATPKVIIAMSARVHGATPSVLSPQVLWNADVLSVTSAGGASRQ
jgi:peptide/nickel transport system substrate-binding protein